MLKLPQMGEGIHEATLIKWFKKPGDPVTKDEPLVEIATDKVDTEIVAPSSGYLIAIFAKPGEQVRVQQVLAQISLSADAKVLVPSQDLASAPQLARGVKKPVQPSYPAPSAGALNFMGTRVDLPKTYAGRVRASPLVKKLARESGVNLQDLAGSGLHGRVTKEDFYRFLAEGAPSARPTVGVRPSFDFEDSIFKVKTEQRDAKEYLDGVEVRREPMSRIRRITAEHMLRSVRVSPHVSTTFEMDFSRVAELRKNLEESFFNRFASKLTYTAFFVEAAARTLQEYPMINASVDGEDILFKESINIGCAVATEYGLIVPVLKNLRGLGLIEIASRFNELVKRAREKRLSPEDVQGGTFSITNPGIYGSLHSQPIINQPQVAILSTGAIVDRPVVLDGKILIRPLVQVGLTFDHRVIDGEAGAKFLNTLRKNLENYETPSLS